MATLSELRTGIQTNLGTIAGLRTAAVLPDVVNPPIAVVAPDSINYDQAFHRGMVEYNFRIAVIGHRMDARTAQNSLDAYCSSTGSSSVKLAIESDKTLGGKAYDVRVTQMNNYSSITIDSVTYLAAEFTVSCYAD